MVLNVSNNAQQKRLLFKQQLESGRLLQLPGAFSPLSARQIEQLGFDGVYISGAVLAADLGLPDIGLTTLTEVSQRGAQICRVSNLPALIDADTGFGEPMNTARTVFELDNAGLSGCHLEDQMNPKRCGHLDHKQLVDVQTMVKRIRAAVDARRDSNFLIMARTDARNSEGLTGAIERARAYIDAGADAIFPEALLNETEFARFRAAIDKPLLANMTEFGKSPLLDKTTLENLGFNLVIYPVSTLRSAMGSSYRLLQAIKHNGDQTSVIDQMQTRAELYELLQYAQYNRFDQSVFNFTIGATIGSATKDRATIDLTTTSDAATDDATIDYATTGNQEVQYESDK